MTNLKVIAQYEETVTRNVTEIEYNEARYTVIDFCDDNGVITETVIRDRVCNELLIDNAALYEEIIDALNE
jgi:hypothetical protein